MQRYVFSFLTAAILTLVVGCSPRASKPPSRPAVSATSETSALLVRRQHFREVNATYRFSADIPASWQVAYVPHTQALNLYDPTVSASSTLEQSQVFIRFFEADQFLTLATVTIHQRRDDTVSGHPAVRYEIEKKPGVPAFAHQPSWRSQRHHVVDVRLAPTGRTTFYVIAANPQLDDRVLESFLTSLRFDGDVAP